jgi:hypothetical protein
LAEYANKDSRSKTSRAEPRVSEGSSKRPRKSSSSIFDACADKWEEQQRHASTTEGTASEALPAMEPVQQSEGEASGSGAHQYPAFPPSTGNALQDEALQGLLMAWYYSGYSTGRYQAMQEMGAFTSAAAAGTTALAQEAAGGRGEGRGAGES